MKNLQITSEETGKIEGKSNIEIYSEITTIGSLFSLYETEYYTIGIYQNETIYYVKKFSSSLDIRAIDFNDLLTAIKNKDAVSIVDTNPLVVDEDLLKEDELELYLKLKEAMDEIVRAYYPDYSYLTSKTKKDHLKDLAKKCGLSYRSFRAKITRFFTHGMKDYALLSKRSAVFGDRRKRNKPYNYTEKTGRKVRDKNGEVIEQGIIITPEIEEQILKFASLVKSGLSIKQAYDHYNARFQLKENPYQKGDKFLEDKDKRPTINQFRYIICKHLSKRDKIIGQKGYGGYYNNHRPLVGDTISDTAFPGDVVEIDAWEADISLIRRGTTDQVISRPTLYLMVDRYTRMIVAFYIGFEVNSYLGLSSLFMNLAEDKKAIFDKYGFTLDRKNIPLPEPFLPNVVVSDNGADFKSGNFKDALSRLRVEHQIAPPRAGSAKGVVERAFGKLSHNHKDILSGRGLIKKEYGSKHHEQATLDLDDYTKLILLSIMEENTKVMQSYPVHDKELLDKDIPLSPINLWFYYTEEKMLRPRAITDTNQFYFDLMEKIKVSLNRDGLVYEDLYYSLGQNQKLHDLQEREKTKTLDFRIDPRDVSRIYYLENGKLSWCELNERKASNWPSMGLTLKGHREYRKELKDYRRQGIEVNENIQVASLVLQDEIASQAAKEKNLNSFEKNNTKNIRENRKEEKYERAYEGRIALKLEDNEEDLLALESKEALPDVHHEEGETIYEDYLDVFEDNM